MKLQDIYYHIRQPENYEDFWKINQEFSYIDPFHKFSKKKGSAKIMTAIYYIYDPKSQLENSGMAVEEVKADISKNFLGKEDFDWEKHREVIVAYQHYSKTKIEKALDSWWNDLEEREDYLKNRLTYEDDPDLRERMLLKTDEHFNKYKNIKESLKQERQEDFMKGKYSVSWIESFAAKDI